MAPELLGLYKLSAKTIQKCIQRTILDIHGKPVPGCSKNEIAALIYMSHIADQSGNIADFTVSQLKNAISCSRRDSFLVLSNLEQKGFLQIQNRRWNGYMDIVLCDNDFSSISTYTGKNRYLNTNHCFFDRTDESFYQAFRGLSLYATRMLLYLLLCYNADFGYQITYTSMAEILGVKSRSLIHNYLQELNPLLGLFCDQSFYQSIKDDRRGYLYGRIKIYHRNTMLIPDTGLRESQDSYYKRFWLTKFRNGTYTVDGYNTSPEGFAQQLFQIASHFIDSYKKTRTFIENVIDEQIQYFGVVSERTLYHIYDRLSSLCSPA